MRDFHTIVRPLGESRLGSSTQVQWRDTTVEARTLAAGSPQLERQGFGATYEEFSEQLSKIPRLFLEPDGSYVWVCSEDPTRRVWGQITDDGQQVLYLELRGRCRWGDLAAIVGLIGWPETQLIFQLMPEAVLVEESQFRAVVCA